GFGRSAISRTSGPPCLRMSTAFMAWSSPLEPGGTFLDVGVEPLARVLGLEQLLLQLALQGQGLGERDLAARDDAPLDPSDRRARLVRRAEFPRVGHHLAPPVVRLEDAGDQTERGRLVEGEGAAGRHQLDRLR